MSQADKQMFSKVRIARELLREKAEEILAEYMDVIAKAKDSGDYMTAAKSLQWLIDHMPADDAGGRIVDSSADKQQKVIEAPKAPPAVQIGIVVGGVGSQKALPKPKDKPVVEVIDAE